MASEVRLRARLLAVVVVCLASAASVPARAEPSLSDRETARSLMADGDAKRDKGDLQGALKSYEGADAIMHVPTTGLEVARTQAALGLLLEARETLSRVARIPVKPNETPVLAAARKSAEQLSDDLAARIPTITVAVKNASPSQPYDVLVDGDAIPRAAAEAPRKVNPGAHTVVVRAGAVEKKDDVRVAEKEQKVVTVDLAPEPPQAAPADAAVTTRGAPLPTILIFGGFGLAVVGVGVGSITGLMSMSKVDDIKKTCTPDCLPSQQADIDSAKSLGTISTVAFIAGGVGVGAGIVGLVLSKREGRAHEARVTPSVGPTWAGLSGTF